MATTEAKVLMTCKDASGNKMLAGDGRREKHRRFCSSQPHPQLCGFFECRRHGGQRERLYLWGADQRPGREQQPDDKQIFVCV